MNVPVLNIPSLEVVTANPGQTAFDIPFTFFLAAEIACWVDQDPAVGFGVVGMGAADGGTLTLSSPCAGGERITIARVTAQKRETEIGVGADFRADAINEELSRLAMQVQDLQVKVGRAAQLALTDPLVDMTLPTLAARAGKAAGWDEDGLPGVSTLSLADIEGGVTIATTQAGIATTQAGIATTQAGIATTQAGIATTQAGIATAQAAASAASALNAQAAVQSVSWRNVRYVTSAASPVTLVDEDGGALFICDTSGGAIVFNLPSIGGLGLVDDVAWSVAMQKKTGDANAVTINRNGTDTIDGGTAAVVLESLNAGVQLVADATPAPDDWGTLVVTAVPPDKSVTFAKIQDIASARLLGRFTGGSGSAEEIQIGSGLQLTGGVLSAPAATLAARYMAASALTPVVAGGVGGKIGSFYHADSFASDTLATKTNANYSAANDWYEPQRIWTTTFDATVSAAFTGSLLARNQYGFKQVMLASVFSASGSAIRFSLRGQAAEGFTTLSFDFGEKAASGNAWDRVGSTTQITADNGSASFTIPTGALKVTDEITMTFDHTKDYVASFGVNNSNDNLVHRSTATTGLSFYEKSGGYTDYMNATPSGYGAQGALSMIEKIEVATGYLNMTLRPTAQTLVAADPDIVRGFFLISPVDSISMGVDVIGKASINGGSGYATGTWTRVGDYGSFQQWCLEVDVSAQTGSSLIWEITTANNKNLRIKQCTGLVPE
ncbi:hypothetical protein [Ferrovibrio terrae]|uniref:hypothetical protein n=1 Tax=Ferrovibrio terrae TaxID=2594003 RepID=UPI003137CF4E